MSSFPEKHPPFKELFGINTFEIDCTSNFNVKYLGPVEAAALIDLARARLFLGEDMEGEAGAAQPRGFTCSHSPVSPVSPGTQSW